MSKKLYHADVKAMVASGEHGDATDILLERCPQASRKFKALCKSMKAFLDEIEKDFPDACYYTASGGFCLILGHTHGDGESTSTSPNNELATLSAGNGLVINDGDW